MTAVQPQSKTLGIGYTIWRILLGSLFAVMGLNGFLLFLAPPPATALPALVVEWNSAVFSSHFIWMTSGFQLIAGLLLLVNRYVLVALIILAGILVNIVTFHITFWPQTIVPLPILAVLLWFLTCWPLRDRFAPLFAAKL